MSNELRVYESAFGNADGFANARNMHVTAFGGGELGSCIQFTIGDEYTTLSEKQLLDLISVISNRIGCMNGFSATDTIDTITIDKNGKSKETDD